MNVLLKVAVMLKAGKSLMECVLRDELEDVDSEYHDKLNWADAFEHVDEQEMLAVVARIVGRIDQAWGEEVGLVFHHMGLETDDELDNALYYLIMPCLGHGVGLEDDHADMLQQAREKLSTLKPVELDHAPIYLSSPFDDVVNDAITKYLKENPTTKYQRPELDNSNGTPDNSFHCPQCDALFDKGSNYPEDTFCSSHCYNQHQGDDCPVDHDCDDCKDN